MLEIHISGTSSQAQSVLDLKSESIEDYLILGA